MCAAMVGADPDELDQLAGSFDRQAQVLDTTAQRVRAQVHASPWRGGAANRFRADWDGTHLPRLRQASNALRGAATTLRREAADQRRASGVAGGSASSHGGSHSTGVPSLAKWLGVLSQGPTGSLVGLLDILSGIEKFGVDAALGKIRGTVIGDTLTNAGTGRFFNVIGKVAGGVGAVFAGVTLVNGVRENDQLKVVGGTIGVGSAAIGAFVGTAATPLVVAGGAATLYGSFTVPQSNAELDGTLKRALEAHFGTGLDMNNLTVEQGSYVSERYDGPLGLLNSISDGMDYKLAWLGDPAAEAGSNFRNWLRGN